MNQPPIVKMGAVLTPPKVKAHRINVVADSLPWEGIPETGMFPMSVKPVRSGVYRLNRMNMNMANPKPYYSLYCYFDVDKGLWASVSTSDLEEAGQPRYFSEVSFLPDYRWSGLARDPSQ